MSTKKQRATAFLSPTQKRLAKVAEIENTEGQGHRRPTSYFCSRCPNPNKVTVESQDYVPESLICSRCGNKVWARFT